MDDKYELDGSCSDYSDSSSSSSEEECKPKSKAKRSCRKPSEKINRGSQERSRDEGEKRKRSVTSKVVPSDERQRSRSPHVMRGRVMNTVILMFQVQQEAVSKNTKKKKLIFTMNVLSDILKNTVMKGLFSMKETIGDALSQKLRQTGKFKMLK